MKKKYSRLVRMFKDQYLRVCIYENAYINVTFYDVVIFRKVRDNYVRGANLKPQDIPVLSKLLNEVNSFFESTDRS